MLSIEAFAGTNLLMNLVILAVSARCVGYVRWGRVWVAAALGTGYAVAAYGFFPWMRYAAAQTACFLAMAAVLFGGRRQRRRWSGTIYLAGSTVFAGGVMMLLSRYLQPGSLLLAASGWVIVAASAFLSDGMRGVRRGEHRIRIRISTRMGSVELDALVDTGNQLREPVSGLPVVIAGRGSLTGVLDDSCLYPSVGRLPPGFRLVRYGVLGGQGEMRCFRPESVCIWRGTAWEDAPDAWVAVYPAELPASVGALAPPAFWQERRLRGGRE